MKRIVTAPAQIRLLRAMRVLAPVAFCLAVGLTVASWVGGHRELAIVDALLAGANAVLTYIEWCVFVPAPRR